MKKKKHFDKNRFMRRLAILVYELFAKNLPQSHSKINVGQKKIRAWCAKNIVKQFGINVNIEKGAYFTSGLSIGDNSGIGKNAVINGTVFIGNNVMMGPDCIIHTSNHNFSRLDIPMIKQGFMEEKIVYIGNDVWIGSRVIILPGVKIGNGVIIGAGSVVTKNIEDWSISAGNPARHIKFRA